MRISQINMNIDALKKVAEQKNLSVLVHYNLLVINGKLLVSMVDKNEA